MKNILIHLEDEEFELLNAVKGEEDSWKDLLMLAVNSKSKGGKK